MSDDEGRAFLKAKLGLSLIGSMEGLFQSGWTSTESALAELISVREKYYKRIANVLKKNNLHQSLSLFDLKEFA